MSHGILPQEAVFMFSGYTTDIIDDMGLPSYVPDMWCIHSSRICVTQIPWWTGTAHACQPHICHGNT